MLNGFGDAIYYLGDGRKTIQDRVIGQICQALQGQLDQETVNLHIVAHSLGSAIGLDFVKILKSPKTGLTTELAPAVMDSVEAVSEHFHQGRLRFSSLITMAPQLPVLLLGNQGMIDSWAQNTGIDLSEFGFPESSAGTLWLNFYDIDDALGFPIRPLIKLRAGHDVKTVTDVQVDNSDGPDSHTGYWENEDVHRHCARVLASRS